MKNLFDDEFIAATQRWGLSVAPAQLATMRAHFDAVVEANRKFNLTRIIEPSEASVKHYADSLALLLWCRDRDISCKTVLDIGTGAGFPAVPLAVMRPDWSITAIDSTHKKVEFLRQTVSSLGLENLTVEHAHSAHWEARQRFDVVTFRALARLDRALKDCHRFVEHPGWIVAFKTSRPDPDELASASKTAAGLNLKKDEPFPYNLECGGETLARSLFIYRRTS